MARMREQQGWRTMGHCMRRVWRLDRCLASHRTSACLCLHGQLALCIFWSADVLHPLLAQGTVDEDDGGPVQQAKRAHLNLFDDSDEEEAGPSHTARTDVEGGG